MEDCILLWKNKLPRILTERVPGWVYQFLVKNSHKNKLIEGFLSKERKEEERKELQNELQKQQSAKKL